MTKRIGLLLTMALLVSLIATGPAAGGPNIDCDAKPDHPFCADEDPTPDHPDGGTCEASGDPWIAATDGFTAVFSDELLCVDWTTTKEAAWRITVKPNGKRLDAIATVRDSHPGDFCWNGNNAWEQIETDSGPALTAVTNLIPVAVIDACGTEYPDLADPPEDAIPYVLTFGYRWKTSGVEVTVEEVSP